MNLNAIRISGGYNYVPRKLFLVMKITTFLLLISVLTVSASTYAQKITLNEKKASLDEVLAKIRQQSGYDVIYSNDVLEKSTLVTIKVSNVNLEDALKASLLNQPLTYEIEEKTILIKMKEPSFIDKVKEMLVKIDVTGRVVDENGKPLQSVTIKLKDKSQVTITDINGNFILKKVNENAVLIISFIGYLSKEINVKTDLGIITLEINNSKLNEVQVIAYGTTTQRLNTGNISSVKAAEIERQPVNNPLLALAGRVPGLTISQATGLAGGGVTVRIQGQNSIAKGNDPFYVIDGMPYNGQVLSTISDILGNSGTTYQGSIQGKGNPFSYLNPSDIESIEVLKDADATAIYGSRAANGAILITTKKGKAGQTKVDITMQSGIGTITNKLNLLNTEQYLQMRHEAYKNDGVAFPKSTDNQDYSNYDLLVYDTLRFTNWQKQLIGNTSNYTDLQAGISGGSNNTTFRVNSGYHRESTVFPGNFADQKVSIGLNLNHRSDNQKFKANFSSNFLVDNNQLPTTDLTSMAIQLPPNAPSLYNSDGSLNWQRIPLGTDSISTFSNPLATLINTYQNKTNTLISNGTLSYGLMKGLDILTSLGYTNINTQELLKFPLSATSPENRPYTDRVAIYGNTQSNSWIIEPQIHYINKIARGKIDFLLGGTIQNNNYNVQQIRGTRYNSDALLNDIGSAANLSKQSSLNGVYKYNAVFTRINYNWLDKYIINITARRDGSSRFGPENRFHNFGAVGAAWLFSNEDFFKNSIEFVSFGKIKSSYGTTGNDQIGDYSYLSQYNVISPGNPYQGSTGLQTNSIANPYLQWELTKKFQTSIEIGLFKDRVLVNTTFYRNRSSNQLLTYSLPNITGFSSILLNFPATVENNGWEFSVSSENIRTESLHWQTNFNLTVPRNRLVSFQNLATSTYASRLIIGEPIGRTKLLQGKGVNPNNGQYEFIQADGKSTSSPVEPNDDIYYYDPNPRFYGGLSNNISYKGFAISFTLQFVKQIGPNYNLGYYPGANYNQPSTVLNRWQKSGDQTNIAQYTQTYPDYQFYAPYSSLAYGDASYIRLKNASVSWDIPEKVLNSINIKQARIFIHGQNLLTFTKYVGFDPENMSTLSLPPLKVWTLGTQISF